MVGALEKMGRLWFVSFFLLFASGAQAFNITRLLGRFPDFSTFNSYLTQTNVSIGINRRQTITVLVVENSAISPISGKSVDDLKNIMRLHVILDYFDLAKLHNLEKKTALLTNLFQATGQASHQQGFLNVTELTDGQVVFGSAVAGATHQAKLVKSVAAQPFNISVLQISTPILAPGVAGGVVSPGPSSTALAPDSAEAPGPSKATPPPAKAPAPSNDSADAPAADSPVAYAPAADSPAADGPNADSPAPNSSPPKDGPVADGADAPSHSGAARVTIGSCVAIVMPFMLALLDLSRR